jgi:aspartyl-tRNA(Asn)/glutamyl-tRNA(Gln) amidotransferase subunit A
MNDIPDLPLDQLSRLIRDRALGPHDVVEAYLGRIEEMNGRLNAYISVTVDRARAQAAESERRHRNGTTLGPLDGVPIALKDLIDVAGIATSNGMAARRDAIAETDAEVVRRLKAAGAVLLGKLNMHEGAMGATNDNIHFGPCHNPWMLGRTPGGSSGGSGAAVAGGLAAGALGSDNMGSIRIPSAFCGIAGLKPTNDLVSTRGMVEFSWTTGAVGPMTRGVDGVALLMSVLAGPDAKNPHSRQAPEALDFTLPEAPTLAGLKVGLPEPFSTAPDAETAGAFERALSVLAELGAEIQPVKIEDLEHSRRACLLIIEAEGALSYGEHMDDPAVVIATDIRQQLDYGRTLSSAKLVGAFRTRGLLQRRVEAVFREVDVLVAPTTPCPAHSFDEDGPKELAAYMALANLCSLPALSLPMGYTEAGLPLGLQIMAAPFGDPLALRVGKSYEQATDWHLRRPESAG